MRSYELDSNGHVNNAVYLAYAEELAVLHAEARGFGREWTLIHGGAWVVRRHEIIYHRPARFGDEDLERVVCASFEFLLEREPASSILPEFSLDVIGRYFPEYDDELPRRLG